VNGTLKSRLAKVCASTSLKWPNALPFELMSLRRAPDQKTELFPQEIIMRRAI
ncbi:hypothetical protein NDU88_002362, partial [Pleurodeles waltl]